MVRVVQIRLAVEEELAGLVYQPIFGSNLERNRSELERGHVVLKQDHLPDLPIAGQEEPQHQQLGTAVGVHLAAPAGSAADWVARSIVHCYEGAVAGP